jgi:hypothetical protein
MGPDSVQGPGDRTRSDQKVPVTVTLIARPSVS